MYKIPAMRIIFILLLIIYPTIMLSFQEKNQDNEDVDKIIAIVGNNIVLKSEIEIQFAQQLMEGAQIDVAEKCNLLKNTITQKILTKQAVIDSIFVSQEEVEDEIDRRLRIMTQRAGGQERLEEFIGKSIYQYKSDIALDVEEQMIAGQMQNNIISDLSITPYEIKQFYKSIPKDSLDLINTSVEVAQIVIMPKLNRKEKEYYKNKAEVLRLRIKNGEDFGTLARLYSDDKASAELGGDLGYITKESVVEKFASKAFSIKLNEVSNVFETRFGFHFIEVLERANNQARVRHILIIPRITNDSRERAKTKIDSVYNQIKEKKNISFSKYAHVYSDDDESKHNGGFILHYDISGHQTKIPMDKLEPQVAFEIDKLKVGEISKPILQRSKVNGSEQYVIYYLKTRIEPHVLNFKDDYEVLKNMALNEKQSIKLSEWFEERRNSTYIYIDSEYLNCPQLSKWISQ